VHKRIRSCIVMVIRGKKKKTGWENDYGSRKVSGGDELTTLQIPTLRVGRGLLNPS